MYDEGLYVREEHVPSCYSVYDYEDNFAGTTIEGFTEREIARAKAARKPYHDLKAQSYPDLKVWIRSNQGKNNNVSTDDVNLAERMFKADVPTCKVRVQSPSLP